jgi:Tfp pilus assembly protein PilX
MILSHKQHGSTLIVALVMLMLLTLMALSAMRSTTSTIQVVGNAQFREEAAVAAQQGIEQIISNNFTASAAASTVVVTFGAATYTAQVETPTCISSIGLTNNQLDPTKAVDAVCLGSGAATNTGSVISGVAPTSTAQSWCYDQKWDIRATVADVNTGANTAVRQGVAMRVPAGTVCP